MKARKKLSAHERQTLLAEACLDDAAALGRATLGFGIVGSLLGIAGILVGLLSVGTDSLGWVGLLLIFGGVWLLITTWIVSALASAISSRVSLAGALALPDEKPPLSESDTGPIPVVR